MPLELTNGVDRVENITRQTFKEKYLLPQKPVIIKHFFGEDAPLYKKWNLDFFKQELGDLEVGVYDIEGTTRKDDRSYKGADSTMKFGDYLDLVQKGPTSRRLFLFNVFKHKKDLFNDFSFPDFDGRVLGKLPLAFFGGTGGVTRIHRDMDNSNVYLTELIGKKRIILFAPEYSAMLYRYPFGTHTSIDITKPDYNKFPALDKVKGFDIIIEAGDTLFMPAGWWHHVEYISPGIGFSMRSISPKLSTVLRGLYQVGILTHLDEIFRAILGNRWYLYKTNVAKNRASRALKRSS